jgi:hypothetical protein
VLSLVKLPVFNPKLRVFNPKFQIFIPKFRVFYPKLRVFDLPKLWVKFPGFSATATSEVPKKHEVSNQVSVERKPEKLSKLQAKINYYENSDFQPSE